MSVGNIKIDPAQLRAAADQLRTCRTEIETELNLATTKINSLRDGGWISQAGDRLQQRFMALRNKYFNNYPEAMQDYEAFLRRTADDYEIADDNRKQQIEAMLNMGAN